MIERGNRAGHRAGRLIARPFRDAKRFKVTRQVVVVPNLPPEFAGLTIALLTDIHHGPFFGLDFVRSVVATTNGLRPDVVALGGDYAHIGRRYLEPCIAELANLRAPRGVFAILGNHDHRHGALRAAAAFRRGRIIELTNCGIWLTEGDARLRLCGVDDLWRGRQDLEAALGDCRRDEAAILLSHNPYYVHSIRDRRVGLVLSGHTHGGQVRLPLIGPPIVHPKHGDKYLRGLVKTAHTQVYVSHGLGAVFPFVRYRCRAEIVLLHLESA